jgi:DNA-binding protein HU-beta
VNKSDLIARMTERLNGDRATAVAAVNGILDEIEGGVARGERVSLSGFGTFERRERAPRSGRNPRTGEAIQVGPSVVPVFRAGVGFRTLLAPEDGVPGSASAAVDDRVATDGRRPDVIAAGPLEATPVNAGNGGKKTGKKGSGKKARARAEGKGTKTASKAAKDKPGKKAGKKLAAALR